MTEAFLWGFVASFSLLLGAGFAYTFKIPQRILGLIMAFGVGALISAMAYELVQEAFHAASDNFIIASGLLVGGLVFFIGDTIIDRHGGNHRKRSNGKQIEGSGAAILLGTIIDAVPESLIIGLTLVKGDAISLVFIAAVFVSNLPEGIAATTGLKASGWKARRIFTFWSVVVMASGLAALAGYIFFDTAPTSLHAFVLAFGGGAILTMLADTMMPEAFEDSGKAVGLVTTLGFALAFALNTWK